MCDVVASVRESRAGGAPSCACGDGHQGEIEGLDRPAPGKPWNYGDAFVLGGQYGAEGPEARAVLTYSQSEVAGSPHRDDQTAVYGAEQLRPVLFSAAAIAADPALEELRLHLE